MALKAGRVGLDPKYVDDNGAPIGTGGSVDAYTKAETDTLLATKANASDVYSKSAADEKFATLSNTYSKTEADNKFATQTALEGYVPDTQLTANSKEFFFAYDSTSQKYGYKAGSDGAFTPFEEAGGPGWVKPANLITTGLTVDSNFQYESGGYFIQNGRLYLDIILLRTGSTTTSSSVQVAELSTDVATIDNCKVLLEKAATINEFTYVGFYNASNASFYSNNIKAAISSTGGGIEQNKYIHMWGEAKITN